MKVFVGEKLGTHIYVLHENGGLEVLTHDFIAAGVLEYFKTHLPPLTNHEADYVLKTFSIRVY